MSDRKLLFMMSAEQAEAFARLVEAADRGDGDAACRLGDMYREGLGGLRASPKQTFRWYSRSALAGDAFGQNNLGACYEHGLGCRQSYPRAVKWYRLAAAQRHGTASMNLGYCYLRGHGVRADKGQALRLFRLAVKQGEDRAQPEVERLEKTVEFGRIPEGFKDRTGDGFGLAFVGGVGPEPPEPSTETTLGVRFYDATEPGKHLGLVGVTTISSRSAPSQNEVADDGDGNTS